VAPVRCRASTTTKSPATSGITDHDTSLSRGQGRARRRSSTAPLVSTPSRQVGRPSAWSQAETTRSASAVPARPASAVQPPRDSGAAGSPRSQRAPSCGACVQSSAP
jgi:hypothetical protein